MSRDDAPEAAPLPGPAHAALDAFADFIAERVAEKVALRVGAASPRYADATSNPLESERAFLDAARRGDFATFKRCKRVTALWVDVQQSMEGRVRPARKPKDVAADADPDRAELEAAGVRLRPAKGARG